MSYAVEHLMDITDFLPNLIRQFFNDKRDPFLLLQLLPEATQKQGFLLFFNFDVSRIKPLFLREWRGGYTMIDDVALFLSLIFEEGIKGNSQNYVNFLKEYIDHPLIKPNILHALASVSKADIGKYMKIVKFFMIRMTGKKFIAGVAPLQIRIVGTLFNRTSGRLLKEKKNEIKYIINMMHLFVLFNFPIGFDLQLYCAVAAQEECPFELKAIMNEIAQRRLEHLLVNTILLPSCEYVGGILNFNKPNFQFAGKNYLLSPSVLKAAELIQVALDNEQQASQKHIELRKYCKYKPELEYMLYLLGHSRLPIDKVVLKELADRSSLKFVQEFDDALSAFSFFRRTGDGKDVPIAFPSQVTSVVMSYLSPVSRP